MGTGIEAARQECPEMADLLDNMKDQLIIALINRLGGKISVSVNEIKGTGEFILSMAVDVDNKQIKFEVDKKH